MRRFRPPGGSGRVPTSARRLGGTVRRRVGLATAIVGACAVAVSLAGPTGSANASTPQPSAGVGSLAGTGGSSAAAAPTGLTAPWSRELVRYGASDADPYHIAHVRELQYRLKWVGLFPNAPT